MAHVRPFRGLRYRETAGPLRDLVAPPYDVLSAAERDEYAARNPHNVAHLTIPEQHADDRSKFVKYARSAAALAEWRREGALAAETVPAFYRYTQSFRIPGSVDAFVRTSFIALIKVEPYENGIVLPHEQTFPKHKEDRLRILEATRAHLECIFGLYEDPSGETLRTLAEAPAEPGVEIVSDDEVHQRLEPITDVGACERLAGLLANKKVWIADGHHRYETALTFRQALGPRDGPVPEDYLMMALSSMSDPGLVLLPTHRMLRNPALTKAELIEKLGGTFHLADCDPHELMARIEGMSGGGTPSLGIAVCGGGGMVATAKNRAETIASIEAEGTESLKQLDVSILHAVILERLLGIQGLEHIGYTRDETEAVETAANGLATSFLMTPPTVDDMKKIALGGEKMPQKSTYYFPKILSGLVLWSLNDF